MVRASSKNRMPPTISQSAALSRETGKRRDSQVASGMASATTGAFLFAADHRAMSAFNFSACSAVASSEPSSVNLRQVLTAHLAFMAQ